MKVIRFKAILGSAAAIMLVLFVASLIWWYANDPLPRTIRITTASQGSLYYDFGRTYKVCLDKQLKDLYSRRWLNLKRPPSVIVLPTEGSLANEKLLKEGKTELAIMQAGVVDMEGLVAIAPLYPDVVHVIVRNGSSIRSIRDLKGKSVSLGSKETASRRHAETILSRYGVDIHGLKNTE